MPTNTYKVQKKTWNKWTPAAQQTFNNVYKASRSQNLFAHPKMAKIPKEQWKTLQWNAAWLAAWEVTEAEKTGAVLAARALGAIVLHADGGHVWTPEERKGFRMTIKALEGVALGKGVSPNKINWHIENVTKSRVKTMARSAKRVHVTDYRGDGQHKAA